MEKMWIKIGDQEEFDISERVQGLYYLDDTTTPTNTNQFTDYGGRDGSKFDYRTIAKNQITANFYLDFHSWDEFKLQQHLINRIFATRKLMRIRTTTESAIVRFVYPNFPEIKISNSGTWGVTFSVTFDNPSGYRYSLYRSDAIYTDTTLPSMQYGMFLPADETLSYHFTDKKFKVYNPSDIAIDPYVHQHDLKIITKFSGKSMKISNTTNGTSWEYKKESKGKESIILDGINTTTDGNPTSMFTDFGNIVLNTGWNDIEVSGTDSQDLTFSFPFIYI